MSSALEQLPSRRAGAGRSLTRWTAALAVSSLCIASIAMPASAATGTAADGATVTAPDSVVTGQTIHVEGSGFEAPATLGDVGSVLGIKLDDGPLSPVTAPVNPSTGIANAGVYAIVQADADGNWEADLPFPTAANTEAADRFDPAAWAVGTTHNVRVLTGSLLSGDQPRTVSVSFTVEAAPVVAALTATAANSTRSNTLGQVTISLSGQSFTAGDDLSVTVDGAPATWSTKPTVAADGTFSGGRVIYTRGNIRAGEHAISVSNGTVTAQTTVKVTPTLTWTGLAQGTEGVLTVLNLPTGSSVSGVTLGDVEFDLPGGGVPAQSDGTATVDYSVPADATLGTLPVTLTQTGPDATYTDATSKISPSSETYNEDAFTVLQTPDVIEQGLYQSAYSARSDSLFATSANVTTSSTLYKLDPETMKVTDSIVPAFVNGVSGAIWAAYGVGVDDVNGTVWVSQTRQNTVAVYDQDDLSLIRQFDTGLINHPRDVVYDAATDRVFVSSASEGGSGDGTIGVFDGSDATYLGTIPTGPRSDFSPVSLTVDEESGTLYTVSLTTSELGKVATDAPLGDASAFEQVTLDLPSTARASGVAYDAKTNRVFVASQNVDGLLVADADTGETVGDVPTGAGALNVVFDSVNRLAYVTNFGGTTVSVADADGDLLASLRFARPNHVSTDGKGNVYAVNKDTNNTIIKITPNAVTSAVPTISGTIKVGSKVSAKAGTWTDGATLKYQWNADGKAISGATSSSYTIPASLAGKKLSVTVTGTKLPWTSVSKTSGASTVAKATLTSATPKISGTVKVGSKVTAKAGTWTSGTTLKYQWKVNGKSISGATKSTYTPTASRKGDKLTVTVTGSKSGYTTVAKTSAASTVKAGTLKTVTPKISGTAKVGKKLTAKAGSWTSGTKLSYQWYANGKAIKKATKSTFTATSTQQGKKITVKVTGKKSGYTTVTKVSKATAKVAKR
ncbi:hypothetical protein [Tessaracoccus palaemonis]|uniref:DNA-binding beta-propeller fold protein YncE n=1 Tax=Tessaracoccus palaemonis TaxID=2829499 RepID=A0ABX8SSJ3_9ACTN|nr:hypothetical protein [Tessaracoccus palaemonis]QXT64154.1 hypothetical protein KDB89_06815 [Tessaracoccus palaemonis]